MLEEDFTIAFVFDMNQTEKSMHESAKLVLRSSVSDLIKPLTIRDVQLTIHG